MLARSVGQQAWREEKRKLRGLRRCAGTQRGIACLEREEAKVERAEKVCWHVAWDSKPGERRSKSQKD